MYHRFVLIEAPFGNVHGHDTDKPITTTSDEAKAVLGDGEIGSHPYTVMNFALLMYYRVDGAKAQLPTNPKMMAMQGTVLFGISRGQELHGLTDEQFEIVANCLAAQMNSSPAQLTHFI